VDVVVNSAELVPGFLPNVCVKTGLPADTTRKARFYYRPPWIYLFLFLGFGILLIALLGAAVGKNVSIDFPVSNTVIRNHRRRMRIAVTTMVGGPVVLGFLAVAARSSGLALAAVACFLVGIIMVMMAQSWLVGKLGKDGQLTLKKVSPEWARQRAELVHNYWVMAQQHHQYAAQQYATAQQYSALQYAPQQYPAPQYQPQLPGDAGYILPGR
jgi:hypothetical protein